MIGAMHHVVRDLGEWHGLTQQARLLLFKHSPTCPISAAALAEFEAWRAAAGDPPTALVDVVHQRPVSQAIAAECGVRHESPQAILFVAGRVAWHASHWDITRGALATAWAASER